MDTGECVDISGWIGRYDKAELESDFIFFYSGFQSGDSGYVNGRTVYAVDNDVFDELAEYIIAEGQLNDP